MRSVSLLARSLAMAAASIAGAAESELRLRVQPLQVGRRVPEDFLGFSFEATLIGDDWQFPSKPSPMDQLYRELEPGVIRMGGNLVDNRVDNKPDLAAYDRTIAFFKRNPRWKWMLGVGLANRDSAGAAATAAYVQPRMGSQLLAWEVGNEVDFFPNGTRRPKDWGVDDFASEFDGFRRNMLAKAPQAVFSGPTGGDARWVWPFAALRAEAVSMLTQHTYVTGPGKDPSIGYRNILPLAARTGQRMIAKNLAEAARTWGKTSRIAECNTIWGGGRPGVSDGFGAALWTADFLFATAQEGVDGVNFHGGNYGKGLVIPYSSIGITADNRPYARAPYYGSLLFRKAARGRFVSATPDNPQANVGAYAFAGDDDSLRIALVNLDTATSWKIHLDSLGDRGEGGLLALSGNLYDTSAITFSGDSVTATRPWRPKPSKFSFAGPVSLTLPPARAVLLVAPPRRTPSRWETSLPWTWQAEAGGLRACRRYEGGNFSQGAVVGAMDSATSAATLRWVNLPAAGTARWRYLFSNGTTGKSTHRITIGSSTLEPSLPSTGGWSTIDSVEFETQVDSGETQIRIGKGSNFAQADAIRLVSLRPKTSPAGQPGSFQTAIGVEWADRAWRIHGAAAGSIFQVRELSGELSMDATLTGESAFHRLEDSRHPKRGIKVWTLHQPGVPVVKGRLLLLP